MHTATSKFSAFVASLLVLASFGFDNLDYGVPRGGDANDVVVIDREGYAVGYSRSHKQPLWVSYRITSDEAMPSIAVRRHRHFVEDDSIPTADRAKLEDYVRSGYDRGHLAPAKDMAWSTNSMADSFYLSNVSPQKPRFNRGIWKELEQWVRSKAQSETSLVVVSGCIFNGTNTIGKHEVAVPSDYFKVILDETPPIKSIGFILPNDGSSNALSSFACTVDDVELRTGMDFFALLTVEIQTNVESSIDFGKW